MKTMLILCSILFMACSSKSKDWDTGASKQQSYNQERQEEQSGATRNQFPSARPGTETQPF